MDTIEQIFDRICDLPRDERDAYLSGVCTSEEQRAKVEALLADAAVAAGYFANVESDTPLIAEKPGDTIGRYKLLQKIGEGGFGVVFMAEQREPIARRVALKIIKQGMDTRQVIARFEAERQALAMMDHSNVARVLDAGATETGRPFFAMELVRGEPITEFCDAHALDTRQRLDLFLDVCSAVNHAHQKGIIHRDLKPSNILVGLDGDTPVVKIIDFGIAKAIQQNLTDKTLFTRFEQFLGTPAYISPEQASLSPIDVDTRSDIYSLGVILYELLAGRPPIDTEELKSAGFDEMRRLIREKEAPKPSTRLNTCSAKERQTIARNRHTEPRKLNLLIKGDLDWVVLKSLEKDRRRRYETANALSRDIRNFLSDQPVSAVAPSTSYRLRKLILRNRGIFAAAAAITLTLVIGLVISLTSLAREKQSRQRAETSEQSAQRISSLFEELLVGIGPTIAQSGDATRSNEVLDGIAQRVENKIPIDTREGVQIRLTIGRVYGALGQPDRAKMVLTDALAGARELTDDVRTVEILIELAQVERLVHDGRATRRLRLLEEVAELAGRALGPGSPQALLAKSRLGKHIGGMRGLLLTEEAASDAERLLAPDDPVLTLIYGNYWGASRLFLTPGQDLTMLKMLTEKFRRAHGNDDPHTARAQSDLALQYCRVAIASAQDILLSKAVELGEESDRLMRQLHQVGYRRRVETKWTLATIRLAAGDIESARTAWEEALVEQGHSSHPEPEQTESRRIECAWMLHRIASKPVTPGLPPEERAIEETRNKEYKIEAMKIAKALDTPRNKVGRKWADHAFAAGDWELAEAELQQLTSAPLDSDDQFSTIAWMKLAALKLHLGNDPTYQSIRKRMAIRYADALDPKSVERTVKAYFAVPIPDGSELPSQVLGMARRAASADDVPASTHLVLGMAEFRMGNFSRAIVALQDASEATKDVEGDWKTTRLALIHTYRTLAEAAAGNSDAASSHFTKAEAAMGELPQAPRIWFWQNVVFARSAFEEARSALDVR